MHFVVRRGLGLQQRLFLYQAFVVVQQVVFVAVPVLGDVSVRIVLAEVLLALIRLGVADVGFGS